MTTSRCRLTRIVILHTSLSASLAEAIEGAFGFAIDQARTRYVPGLVLAEVDYFRRNERKGMQLFMQDLARSDLDMRTSKPAVASPCVVHESHRCLILARADVEISRAETARPIGTEEEARTVSRQRREVFA